MHSRQPGTVEIGSSLIRQRIYGTYISWPVTELETPQRVVNPVITANELRFVSFLEATNL